MIFTAACIVCFSWIFFVRSAIGDQCEGVVCPKGYVIDWAYCKCVKRPVIPKKCVRIRCKPGYRVHYNQKTDTCGCRKKNDNKDCVAQSCKPGYYFNRNRCRCEINANQKCEVKKCKPGYRFNYLICECEKRPKKRNR